MPLSAIPPEGEGQYLLWSLQWAAPRSCHSPTPCALKEEGQRDMGGAQPASAQTQRSTLQLHFFFLVISLLYCVPVVYRALC